MNMAHPHARLPEGKRCLSGSPLMSFPFHMYQIKVVAHMDPMPTVKPMILVSYSMRDPVYKLHKRVIFLRSHTAPNISHEHFLSIVTSESKGERQLCFEVIHDWCGFPLVITLWWTNNLPWKITIFNGKIHYKWPFSIAFCMFTRGYPNIDQHERGTKGLMGSHWCHMYVIYHRKLPKKKPDLGM